MTTAFADRLAAAVREKRSSLVVGLDPVLGRLPRSVLAQAESEGGDPRTQAARAITLFNRKVIECVAEHAVAVKPQVAFYERWGAPGWAAYEDAVQMAQEAGLLVIGDVKRGDIGSTAQAYADAHLGGKHHADAVTLNPYLGSDSMEPFLHAADKQGCGTFVLVRTSNPSAAELQDLLVDGTPFHERVAALVHEWGRQRVGKSGYSSVGAVVGATAPQHLGRLREIMPRAWFLVPGVGAQGGKASDVRAAFDRHGYGALINSSRGILYAFEDPTDDAWPDAVLAAASRLREELTASATASAT